MDCWEELVRFVNDSRSVDLPLIKSEHGNQLPGNAAGAMDAAM